jgi:methylenetetrahydrofolate reductase (NADPH)
MGLAFAADLVAFIKTVADFEISVAAYPETHPQAPPPITISTISNANWTPAPAARSRSISSTARHTLNSWSARAAPAISAPIVPGILPVTNFAQVVKFSAMCGTAIRLAHDMFDGLDDDQTTRAS